MAYTVLVVEDEEDLLGPLCWDLSREGFIVESATTGVAALEKLFGAHPPDLLLLDWMLPDLQGTEICRRVRETEALAKLPIIMLTARGAEADRIRGFELGADDYVVKPFSGRELVLRIRALLRRGPTRSPVRLCFRGLRLDFEAPAIEVQGEAVELTELELKLLRTLVERRGRVQSRGRLLADVWGASDEMVTRTVDTTVKRLRQKLGPAGQYIETLRGSGYRFRELPIGDDA